MIVDFIDAHRDEFGVEPICNVLQFAPSTYRAAKRRESAPSARAVRDVAMMKVLIVLRVTNRKVTARANSGRQHVVAVTMWAATRSHG